MLGASTLLQDLVLYMSQSSVVAGIDPVLVQHVVQTKLFGIPIAFYYGRNSYGGRLVHSANRIRISGPSFMLPAFAAAFLGATAITPGRYNAWGAFIAVYFLAIGITGLQLLGAPSYIQQIF